MLCVIVARKGLASYRIPISELKGAVRIPLIDIGIEVQGQSHGSFFRIIKSMTPEDMMWSPEGRCAQPLS